MRDPSIHRGFRRGAGVAAALALLALALGAAGCDPGSQPLARVGGDVITRGDFENAAASNGRQYQQYGDGARDTLLEALIERQLMIVAAKTGGAYRDTAFLDFARNIREQACREAMVRLLSGAAAVPVSDAEARALWERRGVEAHTRILFVTAEPLARVVLQELRQGADFVALSARFNPPGVIPHGGDLGWVGPGNLLPALDRLVLDAPIGQVTGPVLSPGQGWFFVRIDERRRVPRPPFEDAHADLQMTLSQRKQRAYLIDEVTRLKQSWALTLAPGAAQALSGRLRTVIAQRPPDKSPLPPLDPASASMPLATWRGGMLTLGDTWGDVSRATAPMPNLDMQSMVENWIESRALERILLAEAESRRLADDPDVARTIRGRQENYLLDGYYSREVMSRVQVDEGAMRAVFERNQAAFVTLSEAQVLTWTLTDSAQVAAVVPHMGHAGNLTQLAAMVGAEKEVHPLTVHFPTDDLSWQSLVVQFRRMQVGELAGPTRVGGGYRIVQLVSKQEHTPTWEELDPNARQQLQNQVMAMQREMRFRTLSDSLRRAIPVTVDRAVLLHAAWPAMASIDGLRAIPN